MCDILYHAEINQYLFLSDKFNKNVTNPCYVKSKAADLTFSIRHYAACVVYDANNFLPKNRNFLAQEVIQVLRQSSDEVVQFLFQCPLTKTGNLFAATPRNSPGGTLKKNSPKVKLMSATGSVQEVIMLISLYYKFGPFNY